MRMDIQEIDRIVTTALMEDLGKGDITSNLTIPASAQASFVMVNREPVVVCGVEIVARVFHYVDQTVQLSFPRQDGDKVIKGTTLVSGKGNARSILAAERVALNIMQRMCGIATLTSQYVEAVKGTRAKILDTRKTTPGLRELEKYAVRIGGGYNHRFRLDDGVLIKDNHISIAGGVMKAVALAKAGTPSLTKIEVECDTLAQVKEALAAEADVIMLDNMSVDEIHQAVSMVNDKILLEVSGNVSLETVKELAATGVNYISVGKLTHSVKSADIGLDIE